jgi:hypothetical protein
VGIIALLILAVWALILAFSPRRRAKLKWGRGPGGSPLSRVGCFMAAAAALTMAGGLATEALHLVREPLGYLAVGAGFLTFMTAGLYDTLRAKQGLG